MSIYEMKLRDINIILIIFRYTLFIVLYPLGVTGELLCVYASAPHIAKQRPLTITMPNKLNFAFDFYYAVIVIALLYIPSE